MDVKSVLDELYATRSPAHLANDPLSFCHRYHDPADREIAAIIASSFAYGGIKIILRTLENIFAVVGPAPKQYVLSMDPEEALHSFKGFKHRFNDGRDLVALLWAIRTMLLEAESVNAFFLRFHDASAATVAETLNGYSAAVLEFDYTPVFGTASPPKDSYFRFLFPAPVAGSACKRLCMFLRWVVRANDGVDLGIWQGVSPAQLVIPVDTHIGRICSYLGFTGRTNGDWRMALEITGALRQLDPSDPVKYDFSLAHLGISEGCNGSAPLRCRQCAIVEICPQSPFPPRKPGTLIN